jgi:1,4-alpha-glucan branching enzyme
MNNKDHSRAVDAIIGATHSDPFSFLGMHVEEGGCGLVVRAFIPGADSVEVMDCPGGERVSKMRRLRKEGFFVSHIKGRDGRFPYRLRVRFGEDFIEGHDPYSFPPVFGEMDAHLIAEGTHLDSYRRLGAHPITHEGVDGVYFAVWAPSASRVGVVGCFNHWDGRRHPMRLHPGCGVWEIFLPGITEGALYKFEIKDSNANLLPLKNDPYAFRCEEPPRTACIVENMKEYDWRDQDWMADRHEANKHDAPISIYEVHLGSWRRAPEEGNRFLTYRELAEQLVPYVLDMGFTHVELMPINEFPFDGSWGYQPIGLFAPTSRFGSPNDFRAFVEACHQAGIGVILDWVPGHFPEDEHGLVRFDGTHLYEHADPRKGRHMDWGTLIYNYGRTEVANFLVSNALFWLDHFHIDGLRVDAVASMLYLDYSREDGQWIPNVHGGNENLEAIAFLKRLNELVYERHPGAFTVAEESTAWPMVSSPTYLGGLGFGFKWNMGWMHDTLRFMSKDPVHRQYHQDDITFGLLYAFDENFILPLSHDEVVHGKGSILGRMPGDRWQRCADLRAYYAFMYGHPGKKLLFMGGEFGQENEWNHAGSLDWHLLDDPLNRGVQNLIRDLNRLYKGSPSLYGRDFNHEGFSWIDYHDHAQSILSFMRRGNDANDFMVVICNFTPVVREGYRIGVPEGGFYEECLNTDSKHYGGSNVGNLTGIEAEAVAMHGHPFSLSLTLPPAATLMLRPADAGRPAQ